MATKQLPAFLGSPERNICTGRLLSLTNTLKAEGYKDRHIKYASLTVMMNHARAEGFSEYRYFLDFLEDLIRTSRAQLDEAAADYDQAEREGRAEEYLASL
jgi:hypothetical protein